MVTPIALAEAHRVTQVQQAAVFQQALGASFSKLDPAALDASFTTYLRSALAVVSAGRSKAGSLASFYYNGSREAAGLQALVGSIHVPGPNLAAVTSSLLVSGPVAVKTQLANGVALQAAMNSAKAQTLRAGKRHILNASRETLIAAVHNDADALGWARMSDGQPCHFCAMLVSRGPVYKREGTARFRSHDGCGCSVRPFFGDDPTDGWTKDALALRELWDATPSQDWRITYNAATIDPSSKVFTAFADKVGARIAAPLVESAKRAASVAYAEAQLAKEAAEAAAKVSVVSAEAKAAAELAAVEAKAAAKEAAKVKKWMGKPAPKKPIAPQPADKLGEAAFDEWLALSKQRFADFAAKTGNPKNDLTKSNNWTVFRRVVEQHDTSALDDLKSGGYIDDLLYVKARAAIIKAEEPIPGAAELYKKALRSHRGNVTRYDRYIQEWREVNGVVGGQLKGMSDDVLRWTDEQSGVAWAYRNLKVADGGAKSGIKSYSGSAYDSWNGALRANASRDTLPSGSYKTETKTVDTGAFRPIPEDIIAHRGTTFMEFEDPSGARNYSWPPPAPEDLIGSVQVQHGYMSTSVGNSAAFDYKPVQLKLRVPEGHGATWVSPYSAVGPGEREMILERSTRFFVHDVYQDGQQWIVEAEVIPNDVDLADLVGAAPSPATKRFSVYDRP